MAWGFTKRHQEALWVGRNEQTSEGPAAGQGRWFFHLPPWRRWLCGAACVVGMACGVGAKAQAIAPFVFEGDVLSIDTPDWESDNQYLVAAPAYIDVAQGVQAHIRGDLMAVTGPPKGLYKLGGGTLRLSGANSYRGSTMLLQGGLHVDGPMVFGVWGGIEALRGTQLEYSPDIDVGRPLTLSKQLIDSILPPSFHTPVAPPVGMEEAVRWRVQEGRATHSGLLQGDAPFIKLGAGLLDITGDAMAYTGQVHVAEGVLAINEIFSGLATVRKGARLQGTGSLAAAHIENGATLAPGNSLGAMTVMGNLRFDSGSRFEVEALPTGESDYVWVGGKAMLDGEVVVLAQNGVWQTSTSYSILNAQGGFDDSGFAVVSSDLAFLTPRLEYSADTVTLTLARNDTPIEEVGETPDEEEVGEVIDETEPPDEVVVVEPEPGPDDTGVKDGAPPKANPDLHDSVAALDKEEARRALQQLTGSWNASVLSSVWDDSRFLREAVLRRAATLSADSRSRMVALRAGDAAAHEPSSLAPLEPWMELFHSDQVRDAWQGVPGDTRRLDGVVLGVAAALSSYWNAGVYFGAQRSRMERAHGMATATANIESTHFGLHVAGQVAGWRLALGAARSWHRVKSSRSVQAGSLQDALSARYSGHTHQVFGEAAWPLLQASWATNNRLTLAPFGRLAWVDTRFKGYTETGGSAALKLRPAAMSGWLSTLGLRAEATVGAVSKGTGAAMIHAQLAWDHAGSARAESTQAFRDSATQRLFTSQGMAPVRHAVSLQLGMDARVGKATDVGFGYLGRFGNGMRDQGVGGWARIVF